MAQRKRRAATTQHATTPPAVERIASIDALRGIAILAMVAYHFAFDLRQFNVIGADFENDRFWLTARAVIVTSFLLLAGISLVLADRAGIDTPRFLRRVAVIALCALAASAASYIIYPQTYITFGVLHCIALSSLLARPLAQHPRVALALGAAIIITGLTFAHPAFDTRMTSWLGFTTRKPPTQDFVPMFPWFGVVLLGIALGHALVAQRFAPIAWLARSPRGLRWLGRHSLVIYMAHQPLLLGLLWVLLRR